MQRINTLTSLRFPMIMLIVLFHCSFITEYGNGNFGFIYDLFFRNAYLPVDFFFILSGFGMMYSFIGKNENKMDISPMSCIKYALKHIKKIYFVYIITILMGLPFYLTNVSEGNIVIEDFSFLRLIQFLLTIPLFQSLTGVKSFSHIANAPCWFISSLFCIYLIAPMLLNLFRKIKNIKSIYYALFFCFISIILVRTLFFEIEKNSFFDDLVYASPYCRVFYVIFGMLLSRLFHATFQSFRILNFTFIELFVSVMVILVVLFKNSLMTFFPVFEILWPYVSIIVAALVIFTFSFQCGPISRFLLQKKLVYLGNISMYIFLIHLPLLTYLKVLFRLIGLHKTALSIPLIIATTLVVTFVLSNILYKKQNC